MARRNRGNHEDHLEQESEDQIEIGDSPLRPRAGGMLSADDVRAAIDAARDAAGEDGVDEEYEALLRTVRFNVRRNLNKRLDLYLVDRIGFLSRNRIQKLIDDGEVTLNDKPTKASAELHHGDSVKVVVPLPPAKNIQPENIPIEVLFEDEHIIVLNKQPDIIVHPARSHLTGTMLSALAYYFRNKSKVGGDLSKVGDEFARPGVVHRLDRHTSGCIVFAKTDEAHFKLGHSFEHRRVEKRYLAVVHGLVEPPQDAVDLPIGPHPSREKGFREKQVIRHDELGRPALTLYCVREWYGGKPVAAAASVQPKDGWKSASPITHAPGPRTPVTESGKYSLVELDLKTGRTHQIRVHLSEIGYPIVGDDMYGGKPYVDATGRTVIEHPALHAALLSFDHPITEKRLEFVAPLRSQVASLVGCLRHGGVGTPDVSNARVDMTMAMSRIPQ